MEYDEDNKKRNNFNSEKGRKKEKLDLTKSLNRLHLLLYEFSERWTCMCGIQ